VPNEVYGQPTLETLDLRKNSIPDIPEGLSNLDKLRILNLSSNSLSQIQPNPGLVLKNLTVLQLYACNIRSIADGVFRSFPNLVQLNLNKNELQKLPEDISYLR